MVELVSEILTYTKKRFDPLHPCIERIDIEDIAHALSMLCRANGHFKTFYSVGQHSLNCLREAQARGYSKRVQLACLLHDASEAYLADITRPVKQELPRYLEIEEPLQAVIWDKYLGSPLTLQEHDEVFSIDDDVLYHEFVVLMDTRFDQEEPKLASTPIYAFVGFEETEQQFLAAFEALIQVQK